MSVARGPRLGVLNFALSALLAVRAGRGLWFWWWRAGFGARTFVAGLDGHGPDPLAWLRLLGVWLPATHGLYAVACGFLAARGRQRLELRRAFLRDQATLALVVPLAVGLAVLGRGGPWRLLVGAW